MPAHNVPAKDQQYNHFINTGIYYKHSKLKMKNFPIKMFFFFSYEHDYPRVHIMKSFNGPCISYGKNSCGIATLFRLLG